MLVLSVSGPPQILSPIPVTLDPDAQEYVNTKGLGMTQFEVKLGYDYWNLSEFPLLHVIIN